MGEQPKNHKEERRLGASWKGDESTTVGPGLSASARRPQTPHRLKVPSGFWKKIREHKVLQWSLGYVGMAMAVGQGQELMAHAFGWPESVGRIVMTLLLLGLPVAATLAWYHGHKELKHVSAGELLIASLLLSIGAGLLFIVAHTPSEQGKPASIQSVAARNVSSEPRPAVATLTSNSIAVMPFENLSDDKSNGYFAAGIQDEILTRLSEIGSLKVISRTSTVHLASEPNDLPEIARKLGAANILEGSVQKAGDTVRINVQLIKGETDSHLWADTYDRKLEDVFAVQGEVATEIAKALDAKLTTKEQQDLTRVPTANPEAYDSYLRALALYRRDHIAFDRIEENLRRAVALDSNFARAWALLATVDSLWYSRSDRSDARRTAARSALNEALRLQPDLPEVGLASAYYSYGVDLDYEGARRQFEQLQARLPNNPDLLFALGFIAKRQGRWADSVGYLAQAVALDPFSPSPRNELATAQIALRDYEDALKSVEGGLAVSRHNDLLIARKVEILQRLGQLDEADASLEPLHLRPRDQSVHAVYFQALLRHSYESAIGRFRSLLEIAKTDGTSRITVARLRIQLGYLLWFSHKTQEARQEFASARDALMSELKAQPNGPLVLAALGDASAGLGNRVDALNYTVRAMRPVSSSNDYVSGTHLEYAQTRVLAFFGDRERAIPELVRLQKLQSPDYLTPTELRLDPFFDRIRGDARFGALMDRESAR